MGRQIGAAAKVNISAAEIKAAISCQPENGKKMNIPMIKFTLIATHGMAKRFVFVTKLGASPCNPIEKRILEEAAT